MMPSAGFPDLEDRSVLITGGGSGIGSALVRGFAAQRARVAFIDIATGQSDALSRDLSRRSKHPVHYLEADLRDVAALKASVAQAARRNGPVTILVNNAARDDRNDLDADAAFWDNSHAINLRPHFFTAQAVAAGMKAAGGGAIINFSSIAYMINGGEYPAYAAAKAGIVGLTKSLAGALGPDNIRVNAIAPGWVMTERQRELWVSEESLKAHLARQCLKQEMAVEDLVGPCLFLASDAARMITAQTLIVDAGTV